jgi:hypothetical protein
MAPGEFTVQLCSDTTCFPKDSGGAGTPFVRRSTSAGQVAIHCVPCRSAYQNRATVAEWPTTETGRGAPFVRRGVPLWSNDPMRPKSGVTASVLIPAHQEEAVIGRCLSSLLADAGPDEFEVVVVANGCSDRTTAVVRGFAPRVRLLELPAGSKPAALNEGERLLRHFPRVYLDADVELSANTVRSLVAALAAPRPLLATPRRSLQMAHATLLTRGYFRTWEALQRARQETIGTGVYALNEPARRRFDSFPDAIGDDTFVHSLFRPGDRRVVDDPVKVWPPQRLSDVVAVRTRVVLGNMTAPAAQARRDRPSWAAQARHLAGEPLAVLGIPFYAAVTLLIRARARARLRAGDLSWSRVERSRS